MVFSEITMFEQWLLIDVSGLAYRSFFAVSEGVFLGEVVGVIYGVMRSVLKLSELFSTRKLVWCFDGGNRKRREFFPGYKSNRKPLTDERKRLLDSLKEGLEVFRVERLPELGFRNLFCQEGYEADDVVASVVDVLMGKNVVIVSSDNDLYQLLDNTVIMYIPGKGVYSRESFCKEWGIEPSLWPMVKAIAGCPSDGVDGVRGVGEKTAIRYLSGSLKGRLFDRIESSRELIERNLRLVKLPWEGVNRWFVDEDEISFNEWNRLLVEYGLVRSRR